MTVLDWRKHSTGPLRPCVLCGRPALMREEAGEPCHKACAEALVDRINLGRSKAVAA